MSTDKKIVVISQGTTFTVNAVVKSLRASFYDVTFINPVEEEVLDAKKYTKAFVIFLGPYVTNGPFMIFLGDTIKEMNARVVLLGDPEQFELTLEYLPLGLIAEKIARPIGVKQVNAAVNTIFTDKNAENRHKLLLVDDDPVFLKMLRNWLSENYDVVPVNSGAQALQYLAIHKPDLIMLDYEMPVLSGPQVLESIRAESNLKDIPVFFLTGVDEKEKVTRAIQLKPNGYLLKSYDRNKVLESLDNFFKKKK